MFIGCLISGAWSAFFKDFPVVKVGQKVKWFGLERLTSKSHFARYLKKYLSDRHETFRSNTVGIAGN